MSSFAVETSPVGFYSLLPPLITIGLAIATRRVIPSLLAGIVLSVIIMLPTQGAYEIIRQNDPAATGGSYISYCMLQGLYDLFVEQLWGSLADKSHLQVFAFTLMLGMQIALIHFSGGMIGVVNALAPLAKSRRGGQVLTWALGLIIFIDDYANTLLLGSTMRPVTDKLKISREKLAFLVDSTAAPVSGLAIVSTWVATEISYMQEGYLNANVDLGSQVFQIFIATIPFRFYVLFALIFVLINSLMNRDFGPMLTAERLAQNTDPQDSLKPAGAQTGSSQADASPKQRPGNWALAVIPIGITLAVVIGLLFTTGQKELMTDIAKKGLPTPEGIQYWAAVFGSGDSYSSLVYGSLIGLATIIILTFSLVGISINQLFKTLLQGCWHVAPALGILWLAWALSTMTGDDQMMTGQYLADFLVSGSGEQSAIPMFLIPTLTFILSGFIAFATGTSWGTMAIVIPIITPLVWTLLKLANPDVEIPPDHYLMLASIGSVLAGAIFGDHCSPISDTTVLSSKSSDCDHIAHVRTQLPYAVTVASVSILFGTIPAGLGMTPWLLIPMGIIALIIILRVVGQKVEPPQPNAAQA